MPGKKGKGGEKSAADIRKLKRIVENVPEEDKIRLHRLVQDFMAKPDLKEVTFSNQLSSFERAYVHHQALQHGLKSISTGDGSERQVTLSRAIEDNGKKTKRITLSEKSMSAISALLNTVPDFFTASRSIGFDFSSSSESMYYRAGGESSLRGGHASRSRFSAESYPKVPKTRRTQKFLHSRKQLPIWQHQQQILESLERHRICFIQGATGSGKTTQVPQFILDDATSKSKCVRIICTVPRRLAAVTLSERVAEERGEELGRTVGYHIRLENCCSHETLLMYCTSGILLRSLSSSNYRIAAKTTHIIIDEVHERDSQTDFLLACLKNVIVAFPSLRVILMGADINSELFSSFFGGDYPTLQVDGRLHAVNYYYLEDVLEMLKDESSETSTTKPSVEPRRHSDEPAVIYNRLVEFLKNMSSEPTSCNGVSRIANELIVRPDVDAIIQRVWLAADENAAAEYFRMMEANDISVNYQDSISGVTMLMAAAAVGDVKLAERLVIHGADLNIKSKIEFSAIDWAIDRCQVNVVQFLRAHQESEKCQRLTSYLKTVDEERVDLKLILRLLRRIHVTSDPDHAVLVFLPGYDDIVRLKDLVLTDQELGLLQLGPFKIFILHSNIQTGDQRGAFEKPSRGVRKIVLSTNIAESSLTINDIVHVIDSGRAKEKSFNSLTGVTQLKIVWISRASVNQRRGRAGRCRAGNCYHLYSTKRYESMIKFPIPEIVRTSLQQLSLHAKSITKPDMKIETFFMQIPEPPAPIAVKMSVESLTVMGALDENERLTELGKHLLGFPMEPFLGRALIYAVVFKCLDPILTLVIILSHRDPFQLPSDGEDKGKAKYCKIQFARDSCSDHMASVTAFKGWEASRKSERKKFCQDNYLSATTFEMVSRIREQLLGQLCAMGFVQNRTPSVLSELNTNSENWAMVKGVLVAMLYPNICGVSDNVLHNSFNTQIGIHLSSTLTKKKKKIPTDWIIFDEMTQQGSGNHQVKGCTCVSMVAIALFAGRFTATTSESIAKDDVTSNPEHSTSTLKINQWISLDATTETLKILMSLRQKINYLVLKRLYSPSGHFNEDEDAAIQVIADVLLCEDEALGFPSDEGGTQWPKHVAGKIMSAPRTGYATTDQNEGKTSNVTWFRYEQNCVCLMTFNE
ncbi:unnamed protein product [Orchesella dallaii]|uniref:ATP-dependent RNA helicase YTHDC2 n=1 Tax=Orchesella dallaii TaxID=48710 RepID=A0ABP1R5N4_9HEXA